MIFPGVERASSEQSGKKNVENVSSSPRLAMMGGQYFKGSLLPIFQFTKLELTKAHTKGGTTLWDICVQ